MQKCELNEKFNRPTVVACLVTSKVIPKEPTRMGAAAADSTSITIDMNKEKEEKPKQAPQFDFFGTITSLAVGLPLAIVIVIAFALTPAVYAVYFISLVLFCIIAPLLQARSWLGAAHEWESFALLLRLKFTESAFFRKHVKTLDKIAKVENERDYDAPMKRLVKAQLKAVKDLITGGSQFIEVKDTMSLGSVVVSTIFFLIYFLRFALLKFEIGDVNSKLHDALAIILPLLLSEELAAGMSVVLLWTKWTKVSKMISDRFKVQYYDEDDDDEYSDSEEEYEEEDEENSEEEGEDDEARSPSVAEGASELENDEPLHDGQHNSSAVQVAKTPEQLAADKKKRQEAKEEFNDMVSEQCHTAGVGAVDMTGAASFFTALWTLLFLFQGYVVDNYGNFESGRKELMTDLYWACVIYSFFVVLFCYLPFFNSSSDKQKKEYESVAASCSSYLLMDHLGRIQDKIVEKLINDDENRLGETYPAMMRLRKHAVQQLEDSDLISYVLYIVALSTYNFFVGGADDADERVLEPINEISSFHWSTEMGEKSDGEPVDDVFPSFLLKPKPPARPDNDNEEEDDSPEPPAEMTLFSIPVMGFTTLKQCLIERSLTDFKAIHTNAIVQDKDIYMHNDLMAVGLEVKVMTGYTVCIYIMAGSGSEFGHGPIYATVSDKLKPVISLRPRYEQKRKMKFTKVSEKDQLRALATCTLAIDPKDAEQGFELEQTFYRPSMTGAAPKKDD
ncbi:unnamed protein product [Aphanomyces euteiches]